MNSVQDRSGPESVKRGPRVAPFFVGRAASVKDDGSFGVAGFHQGSLAGIQANRLVGEPDDLAVATAEQNHPHVAAGLPGFPAEGLRHDVSLFFVHLVPP